MTTTTEEDTMETVETRVERGAEFLNDACPGWERDVNVMLLDLRDGDRCVLGQTIGYWQVLDYFGGDEDALAPYGFIWKTSPTGITEQNLREAQALRDAWIVKIKELRA